MLKSLPNIQQQHCSSTHFSLPLQAIRIAVIVPAHNEEMTIGKTLESVIKAGILSKDVYVIDDCSSDQTPKVAACYAVHLTQNKINMGKSASIKRLLFSQRLTERYDLIALLDADTIVDSCYFQKILAQVQTRPDVVLFIGQVKSLRYNWLTSARAFDYTYMHDIYKSAQSRYSMITVGPGCASVYRSSALEKIRISNDTLAEDMDWTIQIHRENLGKALYVPKAVVYTQDPKTVQDYIRQVRRWYTGTWQVVLKHSIPWRCTRIDLEVGLLCFEGLVYGLLLTLLPLLLPFLLIFQWKWLEKITLFDLLMFSGLAIYASLRNRRLDIFLRFPLFYIVRYLNACVFVQSFWRVYLKRKVVKQWDKVKRYQIV
jgi:cellulose synthase/poly-beta-1,6-N-acetylglucosamine synthase-like glycosyltransferase